MVATDDGNKAARVSRRTQFRRLIRAVRDNDEAAVRDAVLRLSRSRPLFAPIAFAVGAVSMLFGGLKLLFSNWRLTLIQILPAMWIWLAMLDLKAHLLRGRSFHVLRGPVTIPLVLAIAAITAACFFLTAVVAFAISRPGAPEIRPGFREARSHLAVILAWGFAVGICLGLSTIIFTRWGKWWFAISLSIVVAVMMIAYVAVPARIAGIKTTHSRQDALTATVVGGTLGALVCTPGYLLGRIALVMFGSKALLIPGIVVFAVGVALQAGTTGAVKAIQMSAKLAAGRQDAGHGHQDAGNGQPSTGNDQPPPGDTPHPARGR